MRPRSGPYMFEMSAVAARLQIQPLVVCSEADCACMREEERLVDQLMLTLSSQSGLAGSDPCPRTDETAWDTESFAI